MLVTKSGTFSSAKTLVVVPVLSGQLDPAHGSQRFQENVLGDPEDPGAEGRSLRIESVEHAQRSKPGFLDDVLGIDTGLPLVPDAERSPAVERRGQSGIQLF